MTNWIRKCSLKIGSSQTIDVSTLRIKFTIFRKVVQTPNSGFFRIYNVSKSTSEKIIDAARQEEELTLEAGYEDDYGQIFKGKMVFAATGRESQTDTFVDISCNDGGDATGRATVNHTFAAGTSEKDKVDYLINQLKSFGIEAGTLKGISKDKDPQSQTMNGHVFDHLRDIARTRGLNLFIDKMKVNLSPVSEDGVGTIVLSEQTGLIGMPQVTTLGIIVTALINPKYDLNVKLKIDPTKINQLVASPGYKGILERFDAEAALGIQEGIYTIQSTEWHGDTRGEEWYVIMACKGEHASGSRGATQFMPRNFSSGQTPPQAGGGTTPQ